MKELISLNWEQVHAWRLSQHYLSQRLPGQDFLTAVTRTGGLQAQVMSAAELALWARTDGLLLQQVKAALWEEHTLVKTWAMRHTLHLLAASDLPLYVAALSATKARNWEDYFAYFGITPAQHEAFLAAVPQILGSTPMTREELATEAANVTGVPELRTLIISANWGSPLKPLAHNGDLCFGPGRGQNVTFVNPRVWLNLNTWQSFEPYAALQEMARRYLRAYGPATPERFAYWWGMGMVPARKLFKSLANELVAVDVEGWQAFALQSTLESMQNPPMLDEVQLLPLFDTYTYGAGRGSEVVLSPLHKGRVFRQQGWVSAVVVVNGCIQGVWDYKTQRGQTTVNVRLFSSLTPALKQKIEAGAERLSPFLQTKVIVVFEDV